MSLASIAEKLKSVFGFVTTSLLGNGTVAGAFTTLSASGNVTLGDAATDTLNVGNGGIVKDAAGNVGIGITPTAGKAALQTKNGITFPAAQILSADANTLDDFERGSWVPSVVGGSTAGTCTPLTQAGRYQKMGNLVFFSAVLSWSGHTGVGSLKITGLPFVVGGTYMPLSVYFSNLTVGAGKQLGAVVIPSTSDVILYAQDLAGGGVTQLSIDALAEVMVAGCYLV